MAAAFPYTETAALLARALHSAQESLNQTNHAAVQMSDVRDNLLRLLHAQAGKLLMRASADDQRQMASAHMLSRMSGVVDDN